jgi:hypothetical protein
LAASGKPNVASSAATAISHAMTVAKPPACASPFTAAISLVRKRGCQSVAMFRSIQREHCHAAMAIDE